MISNARIDALVAVNRAEREVWATLLALPDDDLPPPLREKRQALRAALAARDRA